jgi:molybdate transport system substrate-binding protein
MSRLNILSGGAAQGLVGSLAPAFKARTGLDIAGDFGAVGAMADKLRAGVPTDIIILTSALVTKLVDEKLVAAATIADIGIVETALAVRSIDPQVTAKDTASLRDALLASDAIFVPDTKASTAGIHVAKVLAQLGIADEVAGRLKIHPNGATAMKHLAASDAKRPIGCTQVTEIISTPGVTLSGSLPPGCELSTTYSAGVTTIAASPRQADILIGLLTTERTLRARAGFLNAQD